MLTLFCRQQKYATNYYIAGADGVHPGWAGHLVMAYAFLNRFGWMRDRDLHSRSEIKGSQGLQRTQAGRLRDGQLKIISTRYPFCATGALTNDNSIRSGMTLVPFNQN